MARGSVVEISALVTCPCARAPDIAHRYLPNYDGRISWTVTGVAEIDPTAHFDVTVVICNAADHLRSARTLIRERSDLRELVIVLVPKTLVQPNDEVEGATIVGAPGDDSAAHVRLLACALFSPALADGAVCVDWADVLTVLTDGGHAIVAASAAETPVDALNALNRALDAATTGQWFGVCGSVSAKYGIGAREYRMGLDLMRRRVRPDGHCVLAVPTHCGGAALACALVVTKLARRTLRTRR